jgi:uncharacterized RDD family membrane protein YckC
MPLPRPANDALPYAPASRRLAAFLLDALACAVASSTVKLLLHAAFGIVTELDAAQAADAMTGHVSGAALAAARASTYASVCTCAAYFVGFESSQLAASPGKLALGLAVRGLDGGRIAPLGTALRYLALCATASFTLGASLIPILFTRKRRALHDMLLGTAVVRRG